METKVWDNSFSKEDVEVLVGRALTAAEWDSVVDDLYNEMATKVADIALDTVGVE
jgi:hypothetical protein